MRNPGVLMPPGRQSDSECIVLDVFIRLAGQPAGASVRRFLESVSGAEVHQEFLG